MSKPKVTIKEKSVIIKKGDIRYEVYFEGPEYSVFLGEPGNGMFFRTTDDEFGKVEFYKKW